MSDGHRSTNADPPRRSARAVLGLGVALGLGYLLFSVTQTPGKAGLDFEVYRAAAADLWAGDPIYGRSPVDDPARTYRYPPVALVWFSAYLLVSPAAGYLAHVAGTLLVAVALGTVLIRATERHGVALDGVDRALIVGFVACSPVAAPSLLLGNVNHHVALLTTLGLVWASENEVRAGASLALAAVLKVFPAGLGVWLLWRRKWRAVAAAVATGLGSLLAGALLFGPDRTRNYLTEELLPRSSPDAFAGGLPPTSNYVSIRRPLSVAFPDAGETALALGALALLAPVVWYGYSRSRGPTDRLVALFVTVAAVLVALPSYTMYFLVLSYPLVPLLYVLERPASVPFAVGACLTTLTFKLWDVTQFLDRAPLPAGVESAVLAAARAVYSVGTPVLWGTLLMLSACLWRFRVRSATATSRRTDSADANG